MPRRLLSREDRAEVLALRRREGLSFRELEEQTGIGESTLRVWVRRARGARRARAKAAPAAPAPRFVEVEVGRTAQTRAFEIEVAGGRVVRVGPGFDAAELRRLLVALETPS